MKPVERVFSAMLLLVSQKARLVVVATMPGEARSLLDQTTGRGGWHGREVAAGSVAVGKQKVVSGVC